MPWLGRLLVLIAFLGSTWGVLVVGPKFVRSNQEYTMVISNFNASMSKVNLLVRMEGLDDDGKNIFSIKKQVDVRRYMNRIVNFDIPTITSPVNIKLSIAGQRGFHFYEEVEVIFRSKTISGLVQIDKPVFKPGDTMKFRAIVLDMALKPPATVKSVNVTVRDPYDTVIRSWPSAKLYTGVFENQLQIPLMPNLGLWNISVFADGQHLVSKSFEVKEYVLSMVDVQVTPTVIPLEVHQALSLTITANYHFGRPAKGAAIVELYLEKDELDQKKEINVNGMTQVQLHFAGFLELFQDQQDVWVKVTFIEEHTNRTVVKKQAIPVYKYPYRAEMIKESPQFRPGYPFKCSLKLSYHDGSPVTNVPFLVEVDEHGSIQLNTHTPKRDGIIKLNLTPKTSTDSIFITAKEDDSSFTFDEEIEKAPSATSTYLKLELKSPIKVNNFIRLMAVCNERMTFIIYYVIAKGNILDAGFMRPNRQTKYPFQINALEKMIPKAMIFIATVSNNVLIWDSMEIDLKRLGNHLDISLTEKEVKPGKDIELTLNGKPGAYVALAAYDKSLLQFSKNHDLFWDDVMQVFDEFHAIDSNEFDPLNSIGLFARMYGGNTMDLGITTGKSSANRGSQSFSKLVAFRTNFQESWLWKNVSLGRSGTSKLIEVVPDTTTSWYLTGFSIDPVYGLGIIKKPIEFTTVQPFYIVDSLPYSIKRGEAAVLQFTLFNNLGGEYTADVTLYNVANQMEFVGRRADASYSKTVSVSPSSGTPVSFIVKAQKLGEMVVRVKAVTMMGLETDALEKVIRVIPENVIIENRVSRFFQLETYGFQNVSLQLNIDRKADLNSVKIEFVLSQNLLSSAIENLDDLLTVPSASGAPSMINFIPHLVVLEYLYAVGSNKMHLIEKATSLLRNGYQLEMQYRQPDGSFGDWRESKGSVFVTALVGSVMESAAKYLAEVEPAKIEQLFDWLAKKQDSSGRFDEEPPITYHILQEGSRNGIALTSFVLIAFLQNKKATEKHQTVVQKGIQYIASQWGQITDVYDLSLATYALVLGGGEQHSYALNEFIANASAVDSPSNELYWKHDTASIEVTAYGLLSLVHAQRYVDGLRVMRWLVKQQTAKGSFPRTQDTFVGLKALAALSEAISPKKNEFKIFVSNGDKRLEFNEHSTDSKQEAREVLSGGNKEVNVSVSGRGFGLFSIDYQYGIDVRNVSERFDLTLEKGLSNSGYSLQLRVCTTYIPNLTHTRSNMALLEVTFPSGYVIKSGSLVDETKRNPIKNVELRYGDTSLVVYYESLGAERNCLSVTAERVFKVAFLRPAYVAVQDMYDKRLRAIRVYDVVVDAGDI